MDINEKELSTHKTMVDPRSHLSLFYLAICGKGTVSKFTEKKKNITPSIEKKNCL